MQVASNGDVDLRSRAVQETSVYGFKTDGAGGYIMGFNSNELQANSNNIVVSSDKQISSIELPSSPVNLDLSQAPGFTNVNFEGSKASLAGLTLPNTVTSIADNAFEDCTSLSTIALPASVQSIGLEAFSGCSSLGTVTFASGSHLQEIGGNAFYGCSSLVLSTLPSSVDTIGQYAFANCTSLTSFTIPNGVEQLKGTFQNCSNLASISIPSSVNILQENAFNGVKNGCQLIFDSTGSSMGSYDSNVMPQGSYKVKITGTGIPTTDSGDSIFNSYLSEVTLANTVTAIPQNAFEGCSALTKVTIENTPTEPSVLASIGGSAFYNCTSLQKINIPGTVNAIGNQAFFQAGSGNLTMTFEGNQNMAGIVDLSTSGPYYKVVLKNGIPKKGGSSIFANDTNLKEVVYAGGYTLIANAFTGCTNLTTVTFESYPSIIEHNSSSDYVFPDNVTNIIIGSGQVPIANVENVGHLLTPGRDFTSKPLAVTFFNDPAFPDITILAGAFNFTDADRITYQFIAPPSDHMTYGAGNCFPDGKTMVFSSTNFKWKDNGSTGYWEQQP